MLWEISQKEKRRYYVISLIYELIETEHKLVVAVCEKVGNMGEVGQRTQTSIYERNMFWGVSAQRGD